MLHRTLLAGFILLLMTSLAGAGENRKPPNVVLIFVDDMGYADVGCFGAPHPSPPRGEGTGVRGTQTPNLDRMAREGIRFTDFYSAQAVCSASRAALMTGCYSNRIGILGALGPSSKHGLGRGELTIAEMLKALGYATGIIGKWHLGHLPQHLPKNHGFDEYFGLPYSNDMWPKHPTAKFPDLPIIEHDKILGYNPDQTTLTTRYTERAVEFIGRHKRQPFFLYLAHSMPHVPLFVSDRFKGKSQQGLYGDVIMEIDWSVGRILEALKEQGIDDNTLVIFTSDNGPWLSYGNHAGSAGPLREGKGTAWEGGVRVPFIARWPGRIPSGNECRQPAMTIDMLPTIARLCRGQLPDHKIDGKDISPLLQAKKGATSPHEAYCFYWGRELHGVRSGQWKLYFPHSYRSMGSNPLGKDGRPGIYIQAKTGLALFNLDADIGETKSVAEQNADVVRRLEALADSARVELGDALRNQRGQGGREPSN